MKSEEQIHYESLISFLKWGLSIVGTFILILVSIAVFMTYNSFSDFKKELKENINESKNQINELVKTSNAAIKENKEESNAAIKELKEQVDKSIIYIRDDAKVLALSSAERKIEEAFKDKNIQKLINDAAENEIDSRLKEIVGNQTEQIQDFSYAIYKFNQGNRIGLDILDSIKRNSKILSLKAYAEKIIKEKAKEYELTWTEVKCQNDGDYGLLEMKRDTTELGKRKAIEKCKSIILTSWDLGGVAWATQLLRCITKRKFEMFDLEAVRNFKDY